MVSMVGKSVSYCGLCGFFVDIDYLMIYDKV